MQRSCAPPIPTTTYNHAAPHANASVPGEDVSQVSEPEATLPRDRAPEI